MPPTEPQAPGAQPKKPEPGWNLKYQYGTPEWDANEALGAAWNPWYQQYEQYILDRISRGWSLEDLGITEADPETRPMYRKFQGQGENNFGPNAVQRLQAETQGRFANWVKGQTDFEKTPTGWRSRKNPGDPWDSYYDAYGNYVDPNTGQKLGSAYMYGRPEGISPTGTATGGVGSYGGGGYGGGGGVSGFGSMVEPYLAQGLLSQTSLNNLLMQEEQLNMSQQLQRYNERQQEMAGYDVSPDQAFLTALDRSILGYKNTTPLPEQVTSFAGNQLPGVSGQIVNQGVLPGTGTPEDAAKARERWGKPPETPAPGTQPPPPGYNPPEDPRTPPSPPVVIQPPEGTGPTSMSAVGPGGMVNRGLPPSDRYSILGAPGAPRTQLPPGSDPNGPFPPGSEGPLPPTSDRPLPPEPTGAGKTASPVMPGSNMQDAGSAVDRMRANGPITGVSGVGGGAAPPVSGGPVIPMSEVRPGQFELSPAGVDPMRPQEWQFLAPAAQRITEAYGGYEKALRENPDIARGGAMSSALAQGQLDRFKGVGALWQDQANQALARRGARASEIQFQQPIMTNAGSNLASLYGTDVSAGTARRGQDIEKELGMAQINAQKRASNMGLLGGIGQALTQGLISHFLPIPK